jgi:hypothetical protein
VNFKYLYRGFAAIAMPNFIGIANACLLFFSLKIILKKKINKKLK